MSYKLEYFKIPITNIFIFRGGRLFAFFYFIEKYSNRKSISFLYIFYICNRISNEMIHPITIAKNHKSKRRDLNASEH